VRIGDFVGGDQHRTERAKVSKDLPGTIAAAAILLPIARAHVIGTGVTEDIVERVGAETFFAAPAE